MVLLKDLTPFINRALFLVQQAETYHHPVFNEPTDQQLEVPPALSQRQRFTCQ
jgi:hypothetical protein